MRLVLPLIGPGQFYALATSLVTRYNGAVRLALGKEGEEGQHGPAIAHVTPEMWDRLLDQEKTQRWLAFGGERATVWLRLEIRDGRTVATGLLVGTAEPLSVAELRSIPFGQLLNLAARHADDALRLAMPAQGLDDKVAAVLAELQARVEAGVELTEGDLQRVLAVRPLPKVTGRPKHPGRRGLSPDDLHQAAAAWAEARRTHPSAPMQETARLLYCSLATARRRVRRAQAEGLSD